MSKWEKEPCLSCQVAKEPVSTVTDLLKKLETCQACDKAKQEGEGK